MNDNFYNWTYWYIIAVMLASNLNKANNTNKTPEETLIEYQHLIDMAVNNNPNFLINLEKEIRKGMN